MNCVASVLCADENSGLSSDARATGSPLLLSLLLALTFVDLCTLRFGDVGYPPSVAFLWASLTTVGSSTLCNWLLKDMPRWSWPLLMLGVKSLSWPFDGSYSGLPLKEIQVMLAQE